MYPCLNDMKPTVQWNKIEGTGEDLTDLEEIQFKIIGDNYPNSTDLLQIYNP